MSAELRRDLDELTEIHTNMRWLEFSHEIAPAPRDANDYQMLVKDLTTLVDRLSSRLTSTTSSTPTPALDFPTPINQALDQTPDRPQQPSPDDRPFRLIT
ncbi:hypothetical protein [Actinomadura hibisca]|uniref:hypothetical protein n=1 Tax=Actinomadura hibisca TaxID=68565 RepID=UPI00082F6C35|nr:hypothetical protein [Actinomadura hibisca]